jgi:NAD(P)-dependent dehydrogenase (short-subunit alcohol dehydrogenase family)
MTLEGRTALVSGGLGDIGRATVLALARAGAAVGFCDLRPAADATDVLAAVTALGGKARYGVADVSNAESVDAWVAGVERELGTPDLIVANAAVVSVAPLARLTPEIWRRELAVNLDGAFHVAGSAVRRLRERALPGRIVFVGSWAADHVHLQIPAYCVGKAALRMLMKCMAADLAPHGILVNEIAPGFVDAGLAAQFMNADPGSREASRQQVPVGALIEPSDVARQIVSMCSPDNRHMTGATVLMDGGLSLFGTGVMGRD